MLTRTLALTVLSLSLGCAKYSEVANLNQTNLDYLRQLEIQLSTTREEAKTLKDLPEAEIDKKLSAYRKSLKTELAKLFSNESFWGSYYNQRDLAYREIIKYVEASTTKADEADGGTHKNGGPKVPPAVQAAIRQRLELDYLDEFARFDAEAKQIAQLYHDLILAIIALRKNGESVQEYLEMSWYERSFSDVKGMDEAKLKQIGEDLSAAMKGLQD